MTGLTARRSSWCDVILGLEACGCQIILLLEDVEHVRQLFLLVGSKRGLPYLARPQKVLLVGELFVVEEGAQIHLAHLKEGDLGVKYGGPSILIVQGDE